MKRFLFFAINGYRGDGGWDNFVTSSDDFFALNSLAIYITKQRYSDSGDGPMKCQIVDMIEDKIYEYIDGNREEKINEYERR